ncbi:MAG TPA: type II toxin-antitoxin system VapC family toxin [Vicinamibacterales bacterium]|nr:type II toxin-antitoxin system VapC family toxin [Vicinamibacterales bacterium]
MSASSHASAPRRYYLDTSAYLCMLLGEDGGDRLTAETAGAELSSSVLLILEARRTLIRLAREGHLSPAEFKTCLRRVDEDQEMLVLRDLTIDLCASNVLPAVMTPRSLDLAHLRTALWFHAGAPLTGFITLDRAQADAARELGLPIQAPG